MYISRCLFSWHEYERLFSDRKQKSFISNEKLHRQEKYGSNCKAWR